MDNKQAVSAILDGADVKSVLDKPGVISEATAYDQAWEKKTWDAAKNVFSACNKLWDQMAFAPDKYYHDECQDALNAFSAWYQKFLKVKEVE